MACSTQASDLCASMVRLQGEVGSESPCKTSNKGFNSPVLYFTESGHVRRIAAQALSAMRRRARGEVKNDEITKKREK